MNNIIRRLPLKAKLMILGLLPFCFLVYLTCQIYEQKTEKLRIFESYRQYFLESAHMNGLIDAMQEERKYSFDFAMTKTMQSELLLQRPVTDSLLALLVASKDPVLLGFKDYTKVGQLQSVRDGIDKGLIRPSDVMQFYSGSVFRLNTLNTIPPANTAYLQPIYRDLMAQKALSNMITYLGIIRSNIHHILHTREYVEGTLIGTYGAYEVYQSYDKELLAKASPEVLARYNNLKTSSALKPTNEYINALFKRFTLDDSYKPADWWKVSDEGNNALRKLQDDIWKGLNKRLDDMYAEEKALRTKTLIFLVFALLCVVVLVTYIASVISNTLSRLRNAARKISAGETGVVVEVESEDAVGDLAECIAKIDENNKVLAEAANNIGRGNFDVIIAPRSTNDLLGNAIVTMKRELKLYNEKMEDLVSSRTDELARSNDDLRQFAHVASHDLKEPLRKITMFSRILNDEQKNVLNDRGRIYLQKIGNASERMSKMIEGILAYSIVNVDEPVFEPVALNKIIEGVENDLELAIIQKEAVITHNRLPNIHGLPLLLHQLFYNLINNALKFSIPETAPVISINASGTQNLPASYAGRYAEDKFIVVTVADNGIGFDPAHAEQIFGVFMRLNSKDEFEGSGIGLALCRKIARRHGGDIFAESNGEGAAFYVILPKA